jgi:ribosomal protein S10
MNTPLPRINRPKIDFQAPLQPIYTTVPTDFHAFVKEVNKAFGNNWAPRSAFEEIYSFYLDKDPQEHSKIHEMQKVMSEDFMTTYMLDAIEDSGISFIQSLGEEWSPLIPILDRMSLNERRSFCCKILYQRMKEVKLEELERSINEIKPFNRITPRLTPEQKEKVKTQEAFDADLSEDVKAAYLAPKKVLPPHGITVAQLQIRGHYCPPVDFMADFCARAAYYFGLPCSGPVPLPRKVERWTVVRSPFVHKKSKENFERRTYSRLVTIKDGNPDVVEMWISYCVQNQFHGTGMKLNLFTHDYVGVGRTMSEDIKQLIERDRWSIDGYNQLRDDANQLQSTVDREIARIEGQISTRDNTERAKRVLQLRVQELLKLEGHAEKEAQQAIRQITPTKKETMSEKRIAELNRGKRMEAMQSLSQHLPELDVDQLEQEVEWDKQQDEALRKHILHVGMYAQQKGIGPLTREEYFVYVPHVLLPEYKGIHKDVFQLVEEKDLLRIPTGNTGYLADWDQLTERERFELVVENRNRKRAAEKVQPFEGDKKDISRLERLIERRRNRDDILGSFIADIQSAAETKRDSITKNGKSEEPAVSTEQENVEQTRGPEAVEGEEFPVDPKSPVESETTASADTEPEEIGLSEGKLEDVEIREDTDAESKEKTSSESLDPTEEPNQKS